MTGAAPDAGSFPTWLIDWTGFTTRRALQKLMQEDRDRDAEPHRPRWGRPDYLASLYAYAKRMRHPGLIVEIGVMTGESTVVLGNAIRHTGSHIVSIDPGFRPGGADYGDLNQGRVHGAWDWFELWQRIAAQRLEGYVSLVPDCSANVLQRWDGRPIGLLFVDGAHTYADVRTDCGWMAHVEPGGFAVFDDWYPEIRRAVLDVLPTLTSRWAMIHENGAADTDDYCVTLMQRVE